VPDEGRSSVFAWHFFAAAAAEVTMAPRYQTRRRIAARYALILLAAAFACRQFPETTPNTDLEKQGKAIFPGRHVRK
jgi:hypothetical protein